MADADDAVRAEPVEPGFHFLYPQRGAEDAELCPAADPHRRYRPKRNGCGGHGADDDCADYHLHLLPVEHCRNYVNIRYEGLRRGERKC